MKATTGEGIGFVGRGEGVAALAVATLELVAESTLSRSGARAEPAGSR